MLQEKIDSEAAERRVSGAAYNLVFKEKCKNCNHGKKPTKAINVE